MSEKGNFFGIVVSSEGILPKPDNISKITVTEVRQLLGMGSYYRKFIIYIAKLVRPLVYLTKMGDIFFG